MKTWRKMFAVCAAAIMALSTVGIMPAKASGKAIDFDLRSGYRLLEYTEPLSDWLQTMEIQSEESDYDSTLFDLDGDGAFDIAISMWVPSDYTYRYVLTPVPGGNIHGDFTLESDEEHRIVSFLGYSDDGEMISEEVSKLVFHFPNEPVRETYSVKVNGGKAFRGYWNENDEWTEEEVDSAAPGESIRFEEEKKTGQYLKEWNSQGISKGMTSSEGHAVRRFVMPAHDVSMTPVYGNQTPYTLEAGKTELIGSGWQPVTPVDCFLNSLSNSPFYKGTDGFFDVDGDGTDDLFLGPHKSQEDCSACLFSNLDSVTLTAPNDGPYWPVTLKWNKEAMYVIDMSNFFCYGWLSPKGSELLYKSLKTYELPDKTGFFDLDRDGSEDMYFNGYDIKALPTCSINGSVTIPADEDGVNHPVTFTVDTIPESSAFYKVSLVYENEPKAHIYHSGYPRFGEWFEQGDYVSVTPEPGYQFAEVKIDGNPYPLDSYDMEYGFGFEVQDHDTEVSVLLRNESGGITGYHTVTVEGDYSIPFKLDGSDYESLLSDAYVKEGDWVIILRNDRTADNYVSSWEVTGTDRYEIGVNVSLRLQMQDQDVYVKPVFGKVEPLTIDLTGGNYTVTEEMIEEIVSALGAGEFGASETVRKFDLNDDGKLDVRIDVRALEITPLDTYSCGDAYTLSEWYNKSGRYHPIKFVYNANGEKPTEEKKDPSKKASSKKSKKDSGSFNPLYILIPAEVLFIAALTGLIIWYRKRKKKPAENGGEQNEA